MSMDASTFFNQSSSSTTVLDRDTDNSDAQNFFSQPSPQIKIDEEEKDFNAPSRTLEQNIQIGLDEIPETEKSLDYTESEDYLPTPNSLIEFEESFDGATGILPEDRVVKLTKESEQLLETIENEASKQGVSETEYVQENIYNNMDEGPLRSILEFTGATGLKTLLNIQTGFGSVVGNFGNAIEDLAITVQEESPTLYKNITSRDPRSFANQVTRDMGDFLMVLEGATFGRLHPSLSTTIKPKSIAKQLRKQRQQRQMDRLFSGKQFKPTGMDLDKLKDRNEVDVSVLNPDLLRTSTAKAIEEAKKLAQENTKKIADQDSTLFNDIVDQVDIRYDDTTSLEDIKRVEKITGKKLTKTDLDTGETTIDRDAVKLSGLEKLQELSELSVDKPFKPTVSVENFESIVSMASVVKEAHPKYFKNRTVTEAIFDAMVEEKLLADQEFLKKITDYGIPFEDFILTVVGSSSQAGKILNRLSQLSRSVPQGVTQFRKEQKAMRQQGIIRQSFVRLEGIRRGILVSMWATAARNFQSGLIRGPLEGLQNVADTALYNLSNESVGKGIVSVVDPINWKGSFRHMTHLFNPTKYKAQKEYVDFILDDKSMSQLHVKLFDNINEIRRSREFNNNAPLGRGANNVFGAIEKGVDILNIPNRFQEYVIRRSVFLGELERLVKREYDLDLISELNKGKLPDFLNNSIVPENARSFVDIASEATEKALDVTYAKAPDVFVFRKFANLIAENGFTTIIDFPRFLFNSIELIGNYTHGAAYPLLRKAMEVPSALLTKDPKKLANLNYMDRKQIGRNIAGWAAIYAAYQYRTMDDAPEDYKLVRTTESTGANVTAQFPARQALFLGEVMKKGMEAWNNASKVTDDITAKGVAFSNAVSEFFKTDFGREAVDTFVGAPIRRGVGDSITDVISDTLRAEGLDKLVAEKKYAAAGRLLGNYFVTFGVPLTQIIDAQRALGFRTMEKKDVANDPDPNIGTFSDNFKRPFRQLGVTSIFSPSEDASLPTRVSPFGKEREVKVAPTLKLLTGITLENLPNETGQYLESLGIAEYKAGAKPGSIPSYRRASNKYIQKNLPLIVDMVKSLEPLFEEEYEKSSPKLKQLYSKDTYVKAEALTYINESLSRMRSASSGFAKFTVEGLNEEQKNYYRALEAYSKISRNDRVVASREFIRKFNRNPELYNTEDLNDLIMLQSIKKEFVRKVTPKLN